MSLLREWSAQDGSVDGIAGGCLSRNNGVKTLERAADHLQRVVVVRQRQAIFGQDFFQDPDVAAVGRVNGNGLPLQIGDTVNTIGRVPYQFKPCPFVYAIFDLNR